MNVNENWAEAPYDEELLVLVTAVGEGPALYPGWVSSDEETGGVVLTLRLEEVGESLDVLILDEDGNDAFDPREQPFVLHGWVRTDELAASLLP